MIICDIPFPLVVSRSSGSPFRRLYSEGQLESVVRMFSALLLDRPENKACVRIDSIGRAIAVSGCNFFDFLATNVIAYPDVNLTRRMLSWPDVASLASRLRREVPPAKSMSGVLVADVMANAAGVSVLVSTADGYSILLRRDRRANLSAGTISAVRGIVKPGDLSYDDPFAAAACREVSEELGVAIDPGRMSAMSVVASEIGRHPVFLYKYDIDLTYDDVRHLPLADGSRGIMGWRPGDTVPTDVTPIARYQLIAS